MLKEIINTNHNKTSRNYFERMNNEKPKGMELASKFEFDYWDGDRKHGYGGYSHDERWIPIAKKIIEEYSLTNESKVLDLGCGKAFLLLEIKKLLPGISVLGLDISQHAIDSTLEEIKPHIKRADLNSPEALQEFQDDEFDLCFSIMTFHNLGIQSLERSISEMSRVSKQAYLAVESYRNWEELTNLQCWALTCKSFYTPEGWKYLLEKNGFSGDYEFLYFT